MTNLSPQAQAVKKSADDAYWLWDQMCPADANIIAAAALRALVSECETWEDGTYMVKSNDILEIAKELEEK